jgi:hypothetical protein
MKKFLSLPMVAFLFLMAFVLNAFAQDVSIPADPTTNSQVIEALLDLVGGKAGAGTLAIVFGVAQLLMKFLLSPLFDGLKADPKYKFLAYVVLTLIITVVGMMVGPAAVSLGTALSSSAVLLLLSQYGFRIYELFIEDKKAS